MTLATLMADPLRVVENSGDVLMIENRPIRRATLAAGGMLAFIAAGMAALADGATGTGLIVLAMVAVFGWFGLPGIVRLTQLRMDRASGEAQLRIKTLRGRSDQSLPLAALTQASAHTRYGSAGGDDETALMLTRRGGQETRIAMPGTNAEDVAHLAAVINAWLASGGREEVT